MTTLKLNSFSILLLLMITGGKGIAMQRNDSGLYFDRINLDAKPQRPSGYITSFDSTQLAYYSWMPSIKTTPKGAIIFYHGGGAWSSGMYQAMAQKLATENLLATYLFDIRGHGHSDGARGDTPTPEHVWKDIDSAIAHIKKLHPDLPLYLAGHSSGAGLILNYSFWKKNPDIDGYIFIAPYLGHNAGTVRDDQKFISARLWVFALQAITGLRYFDHMKAVFFNYPERLKKLDPLTLEYYTCAMSQATSPYNPQEIFAQLTKPFWIYVGEQDEQFYPEKVATYHSYASTTKNQSTAHIIPGESHLSIIMKWPELFKYDIK